MSVRAEPRPAGFEPAAVASPSPLPTVVLALAVFAITIAVYLRTLFPSVPFWDAGEFISVSKILGIPHPPGTPLFVLLGRVATLIPIGSTAQRVNGLSALSCALAVMLTYLTALRLIRIARRGAVIDRAAVAKPGAEPVLAPLSPPGLLVSLRGEWLAHLGAVTAALMLAFSSNFWDNATGAEVYSEMSLAQVLVLWLALKWWEDHERRPTVGPLLLSVYVMWLSVGLHLGVGMMGLPLIALLLLVDRRVALLFAMPVTSVLGVTYGLEKMTGIVLVLSILVFWTYAAERKLSAWIAVAATAGAIVGLYYAFGPAAFTPSAALISAASILVPVIALALRHREGRILALALFLMVAGYSTHAYLPIRAARHPAINMGNPSSWPALKALLEREQYGHTSMFVRRGTLRTQLDKEFWRYWKRQWPLVGSAPPRDSVSQPEEPRLWQVLLPLLLGGLGAWWQGRRERTSFLTMMTLFLFSTVGMILFLNFSDHEVRDRDYFFTTGYHTYAIWIGLGIVWLVGWIRDSFSPGTLRTAAVTAAATLLALQPFVVMRNLWFVEDGSRNYVAHDYAWNMLAPLAPNSFVVTNGDNDTYPLWYLQQVENIRTDVRVVNLSLLNTDWYIFQLRDEKPTVPVDLPDDVIRTLGYGAFTDSTGRTVYTNEFMVRHILEVDKRGTSGWIQQPYYAVTVPEHYGFEPYFTLEGLVSRVNRDTLQGPLDPVRLRENLDHLFKYRGLFNADGSWDSTVYKDAQASVITSNYGSAYQQLANWYHAHGQLDLAIAEMEHVCRMFPGRLALLVQLGAFYLDKGDTTRTATMLRDLLAQHPDDPDAHYFYGVSLSFRHDLNGALHEMDEAIRLDPGYSRPYYVAYQWLMEAGQQERAVGYLRRLLEVNPEDPAARRALGYAPPPTPGALPGPGPGGLPQP